jgi:ubiquinone/menaquinone biosynthesis C-methylase UbiE
MSIWGRIYAAGYDHMMSGPEKASLRNHRKQLIPRASGNVLEIGGGTGINASLYTGDIRSLTVTDPAPPMVKRLERRLKDASREAMVIRAPAEDLPFEDGTFDTVVSTLVLCTVDDQPRALRQIRRVLRPGGRLIFLEHVRADEPKLAKWQDRLNWLQLQLAYGCNCNRPTLDSIAAAGFEVQEVEYDAMKKAPPIVRPLIAGIARSG